MSFWFHWHRRYDDPDSEMGRRLATVHGLVRRVLDGAPPGPFVILDICGGQGQAVIPVLASHDRAADVTAYDVELDPDNVAAARAEAKRVGLARFRAIEADAGLSDSYAGLESADFVIMAGVLRHMTPRDHRRFIAALPQLCAPEAWVLWTRREDGRARRIRKRFDAAGFRVVDAEKGPGVLSFTLARMECAPEPRRPGVRWFTFRPMGIRWTRLHRVRVRAGRAKARLRGRRN
jgi:2-polyprenyl-3-methyl-5-hydroxy-6-metoxy-1,4-benzoquinol methylase